MRRLLTAFAIVTACELALAAVAAAAFIAIGAIISAPTATAAPGCPVTDVTQCTWTVEIDGPDGRPIDVELPGCAFEDGNTDGRPCVWFDPDTGRPYLVDSRDYRSVAA